jgi:transcriptional regulator with XRE-family HTH domain
MGFGENLSRALEREGLTQKEVAKNLGVREASISDWRHDRGIPYADVAIKLAALLNTTVNMLVTGEDPEGLSDEEIKLLKIFRGVNKSSQKTLLTQAYAAYIHEVIEGRAEPPPDKTVADLKKAAGF